MAYREETKGSSRWRGFKLEISFQWSATRICNRAYLMFNIVAYANDLEEWVTSKILKFADDTKLFRRKK